MNKKAIWAIVALVAVGIMLGATGVVAQLTGPGVPPVAGGGENAELIDEIMEEVARQRGQTTRAEVAAALMQAKAMGADLDSTTVKTSADMGDNELGFCEIRECEWHLWTWVCPPVYEIHAALIWDECSKSNLDLYICNGGGYAVSNADRTLTEGVAITGRGVNFIWVHGTKVSPYSEYQPYVLAVDCELVDCELPNSLGQRRRSERGQEQRLRVRVERQIELISGRDRRESRRAGD